jgi:hypothetical protein
MYSRDPLLERNMTHIEEIGESYTIPNLAMNRQIMTRLARKYFP